jgi:hypothetical protein
MQPRDRLATSQPPTGTDITSAICKTDRSSVFPGLIADAGDPIWQYAISMYTRGHSHFISIDGIQLLFASGHVYKVLRTGQLCGTILITTSIS